MFNHLTSNEGNVLLKNLFSNMTRGKVNQNCYVIMNSVDMTNMIGKQ